MTRRKRWTGGEGSGEDMGRKEGGMRMTGRERERGGREKDGRRRK